MCVCVCERVKESSCVFMYGYVSVYVFERVSESEREGGRNREITKSIYVCIFV